MTCLLNTYGFISNLNSIIKYLNDKDEGLLTATLPVVETSNTNKQIGNFQYFQVYIFISIISIRLIKIR